MQLLTGDECTRRSMVPALFEMHDRLYILGQAYELASLKAIPFEFLSRKYIDSAKAEYSADKRYMYAYASRPGMYLQLERRCSPFFAGCSTKLDEDQIAYEYMSPIGSSSTSYYSGTPYYSANESIMAFDDSSDPDARYILRHIGNADYYKAIGTQYIDNSGYCFTYIYKISKKDYSLLNNPDHRKYEYFQDPVINYQDAYYYGGFGQYISYAWMLSYVAQSDSHILFEFRKMYYNSAQLSGFLFYNKSTDCFTDSPDEKNAVYYSKYMPMVHTYYYLADTYEYSYVSVKRHKYALISMVGNSALVIERNFQVYSSTYFRGFFEPRYRNNFMKCVIRKIESTGNSSMIIALPDLIVDDSMKYTVEMQDADFLIYENDKNKCVIYMFGCCAEESMMSYSLGDSLIEEYWSKKYNVPLNSTAGGGNRILYVDGVHFREALINNTNVGGYSIANFAKQIDVITNADFNSIFNIKTAFFKIIYDKNSKTASVEKINITGDDGLGEIYDKSWLRNTTYTNTPYTPAVNNLWDEYDFDKALFYYNFSLNYDINKIRTTSLEPKSSLRTGVNGTCDVWKSYKLGNKIIMVCLYDVAAALYEYNISSIEDLNDSSKRKLFEHYEMHGIYVYEIGNDGISFVSKSLVEDKYKHMLVGCMHYTDASVLVLNFNDGVEIWVYDEQEEKYSMTFKKDGVLINTYFDSLNRFYIQWKNSTPYSPAASEGIEMFSLTNASELKADFDLEEYSKNSSDEVIDTFVSYYAKSLIGRYVEVPVRLTLTGGVEFEDGSKTKSVNTSTTGPNTIPVKITGYGNINVEIEQGGN